MNTQRKDTPVITGQGGPPVPHVFVDQEYVFPSYSSLLLAGPGSTALVVELDSRIEGFTIHNFGPQVDFGQDVVWGWLDQANTSGVVRPYEAWDYQCGVRLKGWVERPGKGSVSLWIRLRLDSGEAQVEIWGW